jgi:AbrB family looped-hinge helix DNA binding protein
MQKTLVNRKVDVLGRVVIPKEIRKSLDINNNDFLDIYVDSESGIIGLKKQQKKSDKETWTRITNVHDDSQHPKDNQVVYVCLQNYETKEKKYDLLYFSKQDRLWKNSINHSPVTYHYDLLAWTPLIEYN